MNALSLAGCLAFFLAAILYTAHFAHPTRLLAALGEATVALGFGAIGALLAARVFGQRELPLSSFSDGLIVFGWALAGVYLWIERRYRLPALGGFVAPILALVFITAMVMRPESQELPDSLRVAGLPLHVGVAFLGLAACTVSTGAAGAYLVLERQVKAKHLGFLFTRLPSLDSLDRLSALLVRWGFVCLSITMISGAVFAHRAWGATEAWIRDPKMIASIVAWLIYAVLFHARTFAGWRGQRAAVLTITGFVVLFGSFLLFNLMPLGLHSWPAR